MKKINRYIIMSLCLLGVASCSREDELSDSVFDTSVSAVDKDAATAPFDQWLYDNFVEPYNVEVKYRFNLPSSNLDYTLVPAEYGRSQMLSHLVRYLFFDVYSKYSPEGDVFMKKYAPRIFQFVGSTAVSVTSGTETLGTASGGVKITLYGLNDMKPYTSDYSASDVDNLNDRYFHVMHHEFSHILHQKKSYPVTFGQVTSDTYLAKGWTARDTTETSRLGYVTNYSSSQNKEDFVETLSCIITDTEWRWMCRIIAASIDGVRYGDAENIAALIDSLNIEDIDNPKSHWNDFTVYNVSKYDEETDDYVDAGYRCLDVYRSLEKVYSTKRGAYVNLYSYTKDRSYTSFMDDYLPNLTVRTEVAGINAILKKIDIATTWYREKWNFNIYDIRREVVRRQKNINDYLHDESQMKIYELK